MTIVKRMRKSTSKPNAASRPQKATARSTAALPREGHNRKLSELRTTFYAMFHANPIPTALIRVEDDLFINVNLAFLKYFNVQLQQVLGHTAKELNLGMESVRRAGVLARLRQEGVIENYEYVMPLPSGEEVAILLFLQLLQLEDTEAMLVTFLDITQRREAERRIQQLGQLLAEAEQLERQRLARLLHDDLQQRLFALKVHIPALEQAQREDNQADFTATLHELDEWLTAAIALTRNLSIEVDEMALQGENLTEALAVLAERMQKQHGLQVELQAQPLTEPLNKNLMIVLFQAARELLFNVVKHAGTHAARVQLEQRAEEVCLTVSDHGRGFAPKDLTLNTTTTHGLRNIRQRLELMGCQLEITSRKGQGTQIRLHCPNSNTAGSGAG